MVQMSEILTYTGKMFDPIAPDPGKIDIRDMAHALSLLCRANGHFPTFYSVAQHCIACAREAMTRGYSRRVQLGCLLHDGSEAYLSDVTRPVKKALPAYLEIEKPLQDVIWARYLDSALTQEEIRQVLQIDDELLYYEVLTHTGMALMDRAPALASAPSFAFVDFQTVEQEFLSLFRELTEA